MAGSGALRFDVSGAAGDTCGQRAVARLGDIEAATDAERTLLCYSGVAGSLRKFFGKYDNMSVVARMSTVNSVLKTAFPHMWFVGFYTVEPKHGERWIGLVSRCHVKGHTTMGGGGWGASAPALWPESPSDPPRHISRPLAQIVRDADARTLRSLID